jgi:myo-inositol-1(or 4)-monophosphatase
MHIWDVAPLVPIVEGAGGKITDWHGNAAIGGQGVIATAGPLHGAVVQALNPADSA